MGHTCIRTCTQLGDTGFRAGQRGYPGGAGVRPIALHILPHCRQQLSEEGLERLEEACDMALELNASKHRIYEYVESRMSFIAPNLSIIIGASTAAKIMGEARGQSGGRGPSLGRAPLGKPHPSCLRRSLSPRAPAPCPPCPRLVIPPRGHRGQPPCFSCSTGTGWWP